MKANSKEFYEAMEMFEKVMISNFYGNNFDKEKKENVPVGIWYADGKINTLFKMFLEGCEYSKCKFEIKRDAK